MTLLIAAASPKAIYLSSDYRLTSNGRVITDSSAKLVLLTFKTWFGFVAYTGVGSVGKISTASFVVNWVKNKLDLTIDELLTILRETGSRWLRTVARNQQHTFLFMGFDAGQPIVATVSNFEDLAGKHEMQAEPELSVSLRRGSAVPRVLICGASPAVSQRDFRLLRELIKRTPDSSNEIRALLRSISARASEDPSWGHLISPNCSTISFRAGGQGSYEPDGNVEVHQIISGMHIDLTKIVGKLLGDFKAAGATFVNFSSKEQPFPECKPAIVVDQPMADYRLIEIKGEQFAGAGAVATCDTGLVVGNGSPHVDQAFNALLVKLDNDELKWWDEGAARPSGVNDAQLVSATMLGDRNQAAVLDYETGALTLLPTFIEGGDSDATSINNLGDIAGHVTISRDRREQDFWRPAAWIGGQLYILESDEFEWGYAAGITNDREVLVNAYVGGEISGLRWSPLTKDLKPVGASGVVPLAINSEGLVLGAAKDEKGRTLAVKAERGGRWELLGTPPGYYATTINDSGDAAGYTEQVDNQRPWIRFRNGDLLWLPRYKHHSCYPAMLSNGGRIVGSAGADHGSHALLWLPKNSSTS